MQTGWQSIEVSNGTEFKYYFDPGTGIMQTGWLTDGNRTYYLDTDGKDYIP